ncbi:MAG: hypothetical protein HQ558_03005 [Candidatus Omnitrophica bacterium]|nr:hypothetical protein [Candidatus Omnitrophota bacterium]
MRPLTPFIYLIFSFAGPAAALADDIRDIKPPVYFPTNYLPIIIILGALILAGLIFLIRYLVKRYIKDRPSIFSERPKSAHEIAYEALAELKRKELPAHGLMKPYYIALSNIIRHYIENRFTIKAPEMTTEEFLNSPKVSDTLSGTHKNLLKEFLSLCDIVKFAKYGPGPDETEESFISAKRFVDETKLTRQPKGEATKR